MESVPFLSNQRRTLFSNMTAPRISRIPIGIAITTLIFLVTLWHGRDKLPEHPLHYIKGYEESIERLQSKLTAMNRTFSGRKTWKEIATHYGTDKVTTHHYERLYEHLLAPYRDKPLKMLEIGLGCDMNYGPGASYYTWLEYFPFVDLYYIEFDAACAALWMNKTEKATVFAGDQADISFLEDFLVKTGGDFDVIIDDGGHTMVQQRTSLEVLWKSVKPGGIYFIEDLATSYLPTYGGGAGQPGTFIGDLKTILDDIQGWRGIGPDFPISPGVLRFEIAQEIVALTKKLDGME